MPIDPSDPSSSKPSTRLYQTTSDAPKGGGGGIFFVILLVLLLGGGGAYYFLVYKPAGAAGGTVLAPPPTASSAAPTPKASPKADAPGITSSAQRVQYIKQAEDSFIALRDAKLVPYTTAVDAMLSAGGLTAAGLTSKEAIATRRELVAKCVAANDDYEAFTRTQEATFKAELKKTPLSPSDADYVLSDYSFKAQTDKNVQVRDLQRESFKTGDEMLAYLDKTYGGWSLNAAQHLTFKKAAEAAPFTALAKTYNEQVASINKLLAEIKAIVDPNAPAPGASPAPSPGASPAGTAAPVVSQSVAPAATPVASPVASATP